MEVRILGAHALESKDTQHTCLLVDGALGLDSGSLASALTLEEQLRIEAVLLTHRHFDHIQGIPTLGVATLNQPRTIDVYSLQGTLDAVHQHLLNGDVYPDMTRPLNSGPAKFRFNPVEALVPFRVLGYQVKPIPVPHAVPTIGFIVKSGSGSCIGYTGDAGGELLPFFQDSLGVQVLFVDVTFPSGSAELAKLTGHLTPWLLREQLETALRANLPLPRIVPVHLFPSHRDQVAVELSDLGAELGVDLIPAHDGMTLLV